MKFKQATPEMVKSARETKYEFSTADMKEMKIMDYFDIDCDYSDAGRIRSYFFQCAYRLNYQIKTAYRKHEEILRVIRIK